MTVVEDLRGDMPLREISRVSGISLSSFCYQEKKRRVKRLSPLIEQDIISTASERPCHGDQYISDIIDRERKIEDQIALAVKDDHRVKLLMTIPGINVYSAAVIISEIDDISRFKSLANAISLKAGFWPPDLVTFPRFTENPASFSLNSKFLYP